MGRKVKTIIMLTAVLFGIILIADSLMMGSTIFSQKASAVPREFEENITVPSNQIVPLDLLFTQGDELELIFEVEVKEDLPVDIWFVDYANYVRLADGNEFLYFIDGSGQELKVAIKVVTVTQYGTYELVFANYNNVTVEVNLKYDINVYPEEEETSITGKIVDKGGDSIEGAIVQLRDSNGDIVATYTTNSTGEFEFTNIPFDSYDLVVFADGFEDGRKASVQITSVAFTSEVGSIELTVEEETPLWQSLFLLLPLGLVLGILVGLLISLVFRKPGKPAHKTSGKKTPKKPKKKKVKKKVPKETKSVETEKEPSATKKPPSPSFCGHCGKAVETPFCPFCGKEVTKG